LDAPISAARIIVRLLRQIEELRAENDDLREELRPRTAPANPFPLLAADEIIRVLHPLPPSAPPNRDAQSVAKRRAIAGRTHSLIRAGKTGAEIRAAILVAAEEFDITSKSALSIAANILREESANG
jgi:hypothetical protein